MKGISTIIATLLLLIITIALAGVAFTYISGVITGRTGVVLSLDAANQQCVGNSVIVAVTNDGTTTASNVNVTVLNSAGSTVAMCPALINVPGGSQVASCTATKPAGAGTYSLRATTGADVATGTIYCSS